MRLPRGVLLLVAACGPTPGGGRDGRLEGLTLVSVATETILPGTRLVLGARSLVPDDFGASTLVLAGGMGPDQDVEVELPARFVDYERLEVDFEGARAAGLPLPEGTFRG